MMVMPLLLRSLRAGMAESLGGSKKVKYPCGTTTTVMLSSRLASQSGRMREMEKRKKGRQKEGKSGAWENGVTE